MQTRPREARSRSTASPCSQDRGRRSHGREKNGVSRLILTNASGGGRLLRADGFHALDKNPPRPPRHFILCARRGVEKTGAGGGNRTRLSSLGSSHTTDVLRPRWLIEGRGEREGRRMLASGKQSCRVERGVNQIAGETADLRPTSARPEGADGTPSLGWCHSAPPRFTVGFPSQGKRTTWDQKALRPSSALFTVPASAKVMPPPLGRPKPIREMERS